MEAAGQRGNAFGVGRREQQGLTIRRALAHHGFDVAEKAHVSVRSASSSTRVLRLPMSDLPRSIRSITRPRCTDDDVRAVFPAKRSGCARARRHRR